MKLSKAEQQAKINAERLFNRPESKVICEERQTDIIGKYRNKQK